MVCIAHPTQFVVGCAIQLRQRLESSLHSQRLGLGISGIGGGRQLQ